MAGFVVRTPHRISFDLDIFRQIIYSLLEKALRKRLLVVEIPIAA